MLHSAVDNESYHEISMPLKHGVQLKALMREQRSQLETVQLMRSIASMIGLIILHDLLNSKLYRKLGPLTRAPAASYNVAVENQRFQRGDSVATTRGSAPT